MRNWVDITIIVVYLVVTVIVGIAFKGRQKDVNDYFTGRGGLSGTLGALVVGLSVIATFFSGLSFMAYPSITFQNGVKVLIALIAFPVSWMVLRFWFLKRYIAGEWRHPYEVIEAALGPAMRTAASSLYMMLRIVWLSALMYAPTMAVMGAMNLDRTWFFPLVLVLGLSTTLYTVMGGIRGIMFTDALQMLIIIVGAAFTVGYVASNLPGGLAEGVAALSRDGMLDAPSSQLSFTVPFTMWAAVGWIVSMQANWMADPLALQRYIALGNVKSAARAALICAFSGMIIVTLLVGIGLALKAWFLARPDSNLPANPDKILFYFLGAYGPVGLSGLMLAALLAATMSSISSAVNTLSAVVTLDFRMRLFGKMTTRQELRFGRVTSVIIAMIATGVAGFVERFGTIFNLTLVLTGAFLGPLLVCVFIAVSRRRVNRTSLIVGMFSGVAAAWAVYFLGNIMVLWVATVSCVATLAITVAGTILFGSDGTDSRVQTPADDALLSGKGPREP